MFRDDPMKKICVFLQLSPCDFHCNYSTQKITSKHLTEADASAEAKRIQNLLALIDCKNAVQMIGPVYVVKYPDAARTLRARVRRLERSLEDDTDPRHADEERNAVNIFCEAEEELGKWRMDYLVSINMSDIKNLNKLKFAELLEQNNNNNKPKK